MLHNARSKHGKLGSEGSSSGSRSYEDEQTEVPPQRKLMKMKSLGKSIQCLQPISSWVNRERDLGSEKISSTLRGSGYRASPGSKPLELRFSNKVSDPVYTGCPIKGDGTALELALFDPLQGNFIKHGPGAFAKVELVALDKDVDVNDGEDWTSVECNSLVRDGSKGSVSPLANQFVNLHEGSALLDKVYFRHTRHGMRKSNFRLGAKVVGLSPETRIRKAMTNSFIVKDRREMHKRHYQLTESDEVWRLEKIGKNGPFHKQLEKEKIITVKDFLYEFEQNPDNLRRILGRMSPKMLDIALSHARTCIPLSSQQNDTVVFRDEEGKLGRVKDNQHTSIEKHPEPDKDGISGLVSVFEQLEELKPYGDGNYDIDSKSDPFADSTAIIHGDFKPLADGASVIYGYINPAVVLDPSQAYMVDCANVANFRLSHNTENDNPNVIFSVHPRESISDTHQISSTGHQTWDLFGHGQPSSFSEQISNSSLSDILAQFQNCDDDEALSSFINDNQTEHLRTEFYANDVEDFPCVCDEAVSRVKARRRWKMFNVLRWLYQKKKTER